MSKTKGAAKVTAQVTASEALEMLASAVSYCRQAGLIVRLGNHPNLVFSVEGALLQGGRFIVAPNVTALTPFDNPEVTAQPDADPVTA